jgi:DNA polymerase-3 subunit beta
MASDSEIWMQTGIELAESDGDGIFAIGAHDIIEAVKGVTEQPLTFDIDLEKNIAKISYLNGQFSLPIENAAEFPKPVSITGDIQKSIDKGVFNECISRAMFGCADNELRPVMNGEYLDFTKDYLAIVASDGHKLILNKLTQVKSETIGAFIMPKKVVALLRGTFNKSAGEVQMHFDDRNCKMTYDATTVTFRLIEGRYPNYNSVIPQNNPNHARIERISLMAALKRVINFSNSSSYLIRFHFEGGKLQLDAEDYDFSKTATETVPCEYDGQPLSIGFKGSTLVDILNNYACEEVIIQLSDPSRAALIVPAEQKEDMEIIMLIMPMLLND